MEGGESIRTVYQIELQGLAALFEGLRQRGWELVGPTVRDGAIVYEPISTPADLPQGLTERQEAGRYRLEARTDAAYFGYPVGPQSWKRYLFPPEVRLFAAERQDLGYRVTHGPPEAPRRALIGVRSCDLHAIAVQDRVFQGDGYTDPVYAERRARLFIVAVDCGTPGGTCFCVSMGTGPRVTLSADLVLTEVIGEAEHYFAVRAGTDPGAELLAALPHRPATAAEVAGADRVVERAAGQMGRHLQTDGLREALLANLEHPRWDDVAQRCLSCANCTLVCPTCFCAAVEDTTDITGDHAERWRRWDSCFLLDHSYIHGGAVRRTVRARYRQWLTHKLATWHDQFGTSGCVGCGRCITWCPVGIDLTAEVAAIRSARKPAPSGAAASAGPGGG